MTNKEKDEALQKLTGTDALNFLLLNDVAKNEYLRCVENPDGYSFETCDKVNKFYLTKVDGFFYEGENGTWIFKLDFLKFANELNRYISSDEKVIEGAIISDDDSQYLLSIDKIDNDTIRFFMFDKLDCGTMIDYIDKEIARCMISRLVKIACPF